MEMVLDRMVVAQEAGEWDPVEGMLLHILNTPDIIGKIPGYLEGSLEDSLVREVMGEAGVEMAEEREGEGGKLCRGVWGGMDSFLIRDTDLVRCTPLLIFFS